MPSDDRAGHALESLATERERYRSALVAAQEQIDAYLADHRVRTEGTAQVAVRELGQFASGRIDPERFGAVFASTKVLSPESTMRVERCAALVKELLAEGNTLFTRVVPSGGDLRATVDEALAHAGRSFAAVLAFQAIRAGHTVSERHESMLAGFPFSRWNRAERLLAPPLVIEVAGGDLRAEALTEFLDGRVRLVLVVHGVSSPAPLVRLITPATLVVQASDVADVQLLAGYDGPAVIALLPETAARFVHDPRKGASLRERLHVRHVPAEPPRQPVGARSVQQQRDELAQLAQMVELSRLPTVTVAASVAGGAAPDAAAVDALASWLLAHAGQDANGATPAGGSTR